MSAIENVSRREFLSGVLSTGAFVLAAQVIPKSVWAQAAPFRTQAESAPLNPSVYLGIKPDGSVFIVTHRSEMGTGIRTSLPQVAADELEADWSRVTIEQGIGDPRYGDQNTDGSRSIRDFYEAFRHAGASARSMLVSAAAAQWSVPESECTAQNHEVVHASSGRRLGYGALVPAAAKMGVPKGEMLKFKPKTAWRFVGKQTAIYDQSNIITGKAQFGLDVFREGMVHASIEHPAGPGRHHPRLRRQGRAEREGCQPDRDDRALQAPASLPAARRRGGHCRQHMGRAQGTSSAQDQLGRRRPRQLRVGSVQEAAPRHGEQAGQGRAKPGQCGYGVRQGRQS